MFCYTPANYISHDTYVSYCRITCSTWYMIRDTNYTRRESVCFLQWAWPVVIVASHHLMFPPLGVFFSTSALQANIIQRHTGVRNEECHRWVAGTQISQHNVKTLVWSSIKKCTVLFHPQFHKCVIFLLLTVYFSQQNKCFWTFNLRPENLTIWILIYSEFPDYSPIKKVLLLSVVSHVLAAEEI